MKLNQYDLPNASDYRGASMGRISTYPLYYKMPYKFKMVKLDWVACDYDVKGAYWGNCVLCGDIYWAQSDSEVDTQFGTGYCTGKTEKSNIFVRANSRDEAKQMIRNKVPNAKFYN